MKNIIASFIALITLIFSSAIVDITQKNITYRELPRVESVEHLNELLKTAGNNAYYDESIRKNALNEAESTNDTSASTDYSKTNVQVAGVDESDIVKTNGEYIYQLANHELVITKAYPAAEMKIVKKIEYTKFYPSELYIDNNYIIVLGTQYNEYKTEYPTIMDMEKSIAPIYGGYYRGGSITKIMIYDISDYKLVREVEVDGNYLTSRKVDDNVYIITNRYIYSYYPLAEVENDILPIYRDTAINDEYQKIAATEICYFPDFEQSSYMIIAGVNLSDMKKEVNISTYLGASSQVYATKDTLYVANSSYRYSIMPIRPLIDSVTLDISNSSYETKTYIYKFRINNGEAKYIAKGEVPGTIINQFAMDEYKGNFRIATTVGQTWDNTSNNNLYILDENMNMMGSIKGLAKGERIYSVRFMGDKGYIVTYKNVDPLFVIDLSNPNNPKVLGELKIPGYSDYLHPYKDNYLIGFGKDTVVKGYYDWEGKLQETAYEVGMKIALFDVSDFNNPKELYSIKVGDRGSYSEILNNHKALLFSEEKNIIAFPAYVTTSNSIDSRGIPEYGRLTFDGALIYELSLDKGFELKGKITHQNDNYDYQKTVQRILYINDILYTISSKVIKANDINTIKELNKVEL